MGYNIAQIGVIHSCYKEKFGIPRQPGLASFAQGVVELLPEYGCAESVRGLEAFSHIWLLFLFHQVPLGQWKPTVRPPRLGGNQRMGVYSTRSPYRPNHIGMSVVALERIEVIEGKVSLQVSGLDLVEGTPIIDIKPYLGYVDSIEAAQGGFASTVPEQKLRVRFSPLARQQCQDLSSDYPHLLSLIEQILALDPRPAYTDGCNNEKVYGMRLYDFDLKWQVSSEGVWVTELSRIEPNCTV